MGFKKKHLDEGTGTAREHAYINVESYVYHRKDAAVSVYWDWWNSLEDYQRGEREPFLRRQHSRIENIDAVVEPDRDADGNQMADEAGNFIMVVVEPAQPIFDDYLDTPVLVGAGMEPIKAIYLWARAHHPEFKDGQATNVFEEGQDVV